MGTMRNLTVIAAFMAVAVAAACAGSSSSPAAGVIGVTPGAPTGGGGGSSSGGGGATPGPDTVNVGNDFFSPSSLTVPAGTLVTWNWLPGDVIHTVTFDADTTIMSAFQSSGTYARTFTVAGTYSYHCSIHGKVMTGVITVR
jgi:plastocyanin